jgi:hypothetical protein
MVPGTRTATDTKRHKYSFGSAGLELVCKIPNTPGVSVAVPLCRDHPHTTRRNNEKRVHRSSDQCCAGRSMYVRVARLVTQILLCVSTTPARLSPTTTAIGDDVWSVKAAGMQCMSIRFSLYSDLVQASPCHSLVVGTRSSSYSHPHTHVFLLLVWLCCCWCCCWR